MFTVENLIFSFWLNSVQFKVEVLSFSQANILYIILYNLQLLLQLQLQLLMLIWTLYTAAVTILSFQSECAVNGNKQNPEMFIKTH